MYKEINSLLLFGWQGNWNFLFDYNFVCVTLW
jgi:hypothetical protein